MARILLIEDDPDNIHLLKRLLERRGHEVETAECASHGVERARESLPELILMDLALPDQPEDLPDPDNGLKATRKLKSEDATRDIPVIALTAHTVGRHRERIEAAGCDDLLEKPIDPFESLLEKISQNLRD